MVALTRTMPTDCYSTSRLAPLVFGNNLRLHSTSTALACQRPHLAHVVTPSPHHPTTPSPHHSLTNPSQPTPHPSIPMGAFADRFGRRFTLCLILTTYACFDVACAVPPLRSSLAFMRVFACAVGGLTGSTLSILASTPSEMLPPRHKVESEGAHRPGPFHPPTAPLPRRPTASLPHHFTTALPLPCPRPKRNPQLKASAAVFTPLGCGFMVGPFVAGSIAVRPA